MRLQIRALQSDGRIVGAWKVQPNKEIGNVLPNALPYTDYFDLEIPPGVGFMQIVNMCKVENGQLVVV
jgi:hypothetical protein